METRDTISGEFARKLQIAKQCKLPIGSHYNETRSCPCWMRDQCRLTVNERKVFENNRAVVAARERSEREYREGLEETEKGNDV